MQGTSPGDYLGYQILRGYDHDGDGIADLVVGSALDSHVVELGGVTRVFLDPGAATEALVDDDADLTIVTELTGAFMRVNGPGDLDGDGLDDLTFVREVSSWEDGAGLIVTDHDTGGTVDVETLAAATLFGQMWGVEDVDSDGYGELFATAGALYRYELPLEGSVSVPWDDASASLGFLSEADYVSWADRRSIESPAGVRYAAGAVSWPAGAGNGAVFFAEAQLDGVSNLDDVGLIVTGAAAGDAAGTAVERVPDLNGDTYEDWIIGAPGTDRGGSASGSITAVPGPS